MPKTATHLSFYALTNKFDVSTKSRLIVSVDSDTVFSIDRNSINNFMDTYRNAEADISEFADDKAHRLTFTFYEFSLEAPSSIFIDSIEFIHSSRPGNTPFTSNDKYCNPGCPYEFASDNECDPFCGFPECNFDLGACSNPSKKIITSKHQTISIYSFYLQHTHAYIQKQAHAWTETYQSSLIHWGCVRYIQEVRVAPTLAR